MYKISSNSKTVNCIEGLNKNEIFFYEKPTFPHVLGRLSETWIIIITISHEICLGVSNETSNLSPSSLTLQSKRHLHIMPYVRLCCSNNRVQLQVRLSAWRTANQLSMGANKQLLLLVHFREKAWAVNLGVEPKSNPVIQQRCFIQHTAPHPHDQVRWTTGHQALWQIIFKWLSGNFMESLKSSTKLFKVEWAFMVLSIWKTK